MPLSSRRIWLGFRAEQSLDSEANVDEEKEDDDAFTRSLFGALVEFSKTGHILKVSFPTDFSVACITGLGPGTTPAMVIDIFRELAFNVSVDCVRMVRCIASSDKMKAIVRVEDPSFASALSARLESQRSDLDASVLPVHTRRTNCRKVHLSWHKSIRSVWMSFEDGEAASRVMEKFCDGSYKCPGQFLKVSTGKNGGSGRDYDFIPWIAKLNNVPGSTSTKDVEEAITLVSDRPHRIELGPATYQASDTEVGLAVRSQLEQYGPLETFFLAPQSEGKRAKATALFEDEADARAARALNNMPLLILREGRLTVTQIQLAKIKVSTPIYVISKRSIDAERKYWKDRHVVINVYGNAFQQFTTFKIEGDDHKEVDMAQQRCDALLNGTVLMNGNERVWGAALSSNGSALKRLRFIERDLGFVIVRDRSRRQLRFYGPTELLWPAVRRITAMLAGEATASYELDLRPDQLSWAIRGGFTVIGNAVGASVAAFNVVSRKIIVNGTAQQYERVLAIVEGGHAVDGVAPLTGQVDIARNCPICFCEADNPIQPGCAHSYYLECFEEFCKSAAATSGDEFQIKCQGDEGECPTVFSLSEIQDHVSSSTFEAILTASFAEYVKRQPKTFRCCPTPDCDYIYRCTRLDTDAEGRVHTCQKCALPVCTSCHARHGYHTCAEHSDIASGGYKALKRLKKKLKIKDCPTCTTPLLKADGCNHMTCGGCGAHICWLCMEVFGAIGACYDHLSKEHGSFGAEP